MRKRPGKGESKETTTQEVSEGQEPSDYLSWTIPVPHRGGSRPAGRVCFFQKSTGHMYESRAIREPGVLEDTFNLNTQEAEAGGSLWANGQPGLHRKLQASQRYVDKPYPKTNKQNTHKK